MPDLNKEFLNGIDELFLLYRKIKEYIMLSEEVSGKLVAASVNELRAVLDHILKSFHYTNKKPDSENLIKEKNKAIRHLKRAGYDALEVIALYKLPQIKEVLNPFSAEIINEGYKEYYSKDRLALNKIEIQLAKDRDGIDGENFFDEFEDLISKLIEIDDRVTERIPILIEISKKKKKWTIKDNIVKILIGVLIGLIVSFITWLLFSGKGQ